MQPPEFNIESIQSPFSLLLIGKRQIGKSNKIKTFLEYFNRTNSFDEYYIINSMEPIDKTYSNIVNKPMLIDTEINEKRIKGIIEKQQSLSINNKMLIILDDCISSENWYSIKELFYYHKLYKISIITTQQYPLAMDLHIRVNTDYVFLSKEDFLTTLYVIYKYYGGMFSDFETFMEILGKSTINYGNMVIKNCGRDTDRILHYNPMLLNEDFKLKISNYKYLFNMYDAYEDLEENI